VVAEHAADHEGQRQPHRNRPGPQRRQPVEHPAEGEQHVAEETADLQAEGLGRGEHLGQHLGEPRHGEAVEPHVAALGHDTEHRHEERDKAEAAQGAANRPWTAISATRESPNKTRAKYPERRRRRVGVVHLGYKIKAQNLTKTSSQENRQM
jgi:hypothetical protein